MPPDPRVPSSGKVGQVVLNPLSDSDGALVPGTVRTRGVDKPLSKRKRHCRKPVYVPTRDSMVEFRCDKEAHSDNERHHEAGVIKIKGRGGIAIINYDFVWDERDQPLVIREGKS